MRKSESGESRHYSILHSAFYFLPSSALIGLIYAYRFTLSPALAFLAGPLSRCRFTPTCSQYALDALRTHGALNGTRLAAKRVCSCHPWGGFGHDPVPGSHSPRSNQTAVTQAPPDSRPKFYELRFTSPESRFTRHDSRAADRASRPT